MSQFNMNVSNNTLQTRLTTVAGRLTQQLTLCNGRISRCMVWPLLIAFWFGRISWRLWPLLIAFWWRWLGSVIVTACVPVLLFGWHPAQQHTHTLWDCTLHLVYLRTAAVNTLHYAGPNPTHTRHWSNAGLMLGQHRRRWDSIRPTSSQCSMSAGEVSQVTI